MKEINFIKTSHKDKQRLQSWLKITKILVLTLLAILFVIYLWSLKQENNLHKEITLWEEKVKSFDDYVKRKNELKQEQQLLKKQLQKVEKYSSFDQKSIPANYLLHVSESIPESAYLEEVSIKAKNSAELKGVCINAQDIIEFVEKLSKNLFKAKAKLIYVRPKENESLLEFCVKIEPIT